MLLLCEPIFFVEINCIKRRQEKEESLTLFSLWRFLGFFFYFSDFFQQKSILAKNGPIIQ